MQADEAKRLRDRWVRKGNPPCEHLELDKEYYLGAQSGDYVCMTCGQCFREDELHIDPKSHKLRPKSN